VRLGMAEDACHERIRALTERNPMLGFRYCRHCTAVTVLSSLFSCLAGGVCWCVWMVVVGLCSCGDGGDGMGKA
jgi:hypothetical protein